MSTGQTQEFPVHMAGTLGYQLQQVEQRINNIQSMLDSATCHQHQICKIAEARETLVELLKITNDPAIDCDGVDQLVQTLVNFLKNEFSVPEYMNAASIQPPTRAFPNDPRVHFQPPGPDRGLAPMYNSPRCTQ